jgi:NlpE N-terminal domain
MRKIPILVALGLLAVMVIVVAVPVFSAPAPQNSAATTATPTPKLSEAEARRIAEQSDCAKQGAIKETEGYNANSDTWWFSLGTPRGGCNPACVVSATTKAAEINWRCTGLVQPQAVETPAAAPTRIIMPTTTPAPGRLIAQQALTTTYVALLPAADAAGRTIALGLKPDGSAEFTTGFLGKGTIVEKGAWKDNGDGTLTMTLTEKDGKKNSKPVVMKFQKDGTSLKLVDYDKNVWGSEGLILNQAAEIARKLNTSLFTIDLKAGFPLDPTILSVNGGGEIDTRLLGKGCSGFANQSPVVTVNWSGKADFAQIFFYSEGDPTLMILTPDGKLLCNDDASEQVLDPVIQMEKPVEGTYKIWVGSADKNQLIPGILALTTKRELSVASFNLGSLVSRPALAAAVAQPAPEIEKSALAKLIEERVKIAPKLQAGSIMTSTQITAEGKVPLFAMPLKDKSCAGLVGSPDFVFNLAGQSKNLRIFFEGDSDGTLLVLGPKDLAACNDDAERGVNVNPQVDIANPAEGAYAVFVGRLNPAKPISGKLTITEAAAALPTKLAPAKK